MPPQANLTVRSSLLPIKSDGRHDGLMILVNFRDAREAPSRDSHTVAESRIMEAVPPIQSEIWVEKWLWDSRSRWKGRVVNQVWHIAEDHPTQVVVDLMIDME
jgi:hypothetical protein